MAGLQKEHNMEKKKKEEDLLSFSCFETFQKVLKILKNV